MVRASRIAAAPRSTALTSRNPPPNRPIGVRAPLTITERATSSSPFGSLSLYVRGVRSPRRGVPDNLWDEEHGEENHAELWLRFAEGMGVGREDVAGAARTAATEGLVGTYRRASGSSPVAGLAAVHAYERQVPEVARAKLDGLRDHYRVTDERTTRFWSVHERLDVEHAGAERQLLTEMGREDPEAAVHATGEALDAWWGFLDAVDPEG